MLTPLSFAVNHEHDMLKGIAVRLVEVCGLSKTFADDRAVTDDHDEICSKPKRHC